MNAHNLLRVSSNAALLGGALRIASAVLPQASLGSSAELLYLVIDLALLAALLGIYLSRHEAVGRPGFIGFAIALPALAVIVGPDGQLYGIDVYRAGGALLMVGLALIGVAQLRAKVGRTWSSVGWLAAFAMTVVLALLPTHAWPFVAVGILLGSGFIAAGWELHRELRPGLGACAVARPTVPTDGTQ